MSVQENRSTMSEDNLSVTDPDEDLEPTISDLEEELEQVLDTPSIEYNSKSLHKKVDEMFRQYGQHGTKQRLQQDISKFLTSGTPITDLVAFQNSSKTTFNTKPAERNVDDESTVYVQGLPFKIERTFKFSSDAPVPIELVGNLNKVFEAYELEGQVLLNYYCKEYGPEAIWRSGLRSLILSRTENLLRAEGDRYLQLDGRQLSILLPAYQEFPEINTVERRLLARATELHPDDIDEFWYMKTKKRMLYSSMLVVATAKDIREAERPGLGEAHSQTTF